MHSFGGRVDMATVYCTACGASLLSTMRICPQCGCKSLASTPPSSSSLSNAPVGVATPTQGHGTTIAAAGKNSQSNYGPLEPAGHGRRLLASIIDTLILTFIGGIVFALATLLAQEGSTKLASAIGFILYLVIPYVYFTLLHSGINSASWGKRMMGIIVVSDSGERLSKSTAFIRALLQLLLPIGAFILVAIMLGGAMITAVDEVKTALGVSIFIGYIAIFLGPYLMVFFNPMRKTVFDLICKTRVIRKATP